MGYSVYPAPSAVSSDLGGELLVSAKIASTGSKVTKAFPVGSYLVTAYGSGTLSTITFTGTNTVQETFNITLTANAENTYLLTTTIAADGFAFGGVTGFVAIRKWTDAPSATVIPGLTTLLTGTTAPTGTTNATAIAYGAGKFVMPYYTSSGNIGISTDGISWTAQSTGFDQPWNSVAYNGSLFMMTALYTAYCMTSADGVSWTLKSTPALGGGEYWGWTTWDGNSWLLVSNYASGSGSWGKVVHSQNNGTSWSVGTNNSGSPYYQYIAGSSANSIWYITTPNSTWYKKATDINSWTGDTGGPFSGIRQVIYALNMFVVVDNSGDVHTSTDASTWTSRTAAIGAGSIWMSVCSDGQKIYLVPGSGQNKIGIGTSASAWTVSTISANVANSSTRMAAAGGNKLVFTSNANTVTHAISTAPSLS